MIHILVADDYVIVRKGFTEILFEEKNVAFPESSNVSETHELIKGKTALLNSGLN